VSFASHFPLGKNWGKLCIPIPLFHIFGLGFGVFAPLLGGKESILPFYLPDTPATLKAITDFKTESMMGAPTILIDLLNNPDRKTKYDISSLKNILLGASAIPKDLILKLNAELKLDNIILGYGMTETSLGQSLTRFDDAQKSFKHAFESIGRPLPFTECKIVHPETNKIVPLQEDGELCLRGFNIISEYWDEPKKTAEAFDKHGWFKTGDICHMDEQGYLYFKSRCKDIIIRGGVNIYPAEVEAFLRTHPKVLDAAVVGVPDKRFGEEVCAWLKLKPNETMTYDELKKFCTGNIAVFKIPKYMKVVDAFPINANGKMMKNKIVEMAKKDLNL
jgi:fatty-acyl-CoA synthase